MRYDTKFCVFCHWSYFKNWRAEGFHVWLSDQVHSEWQPWVKQQSEWIGIKMGTQQHLIQCSFPLLSVRSFSVHLIWWSRFCNCFLGHISEWNPCFLTPKANVVKKSVFFVMTFQVTSKFLSKKKLKISLNLLFPEFLASKFKYLCSGEKRGKMGQKMET